MHPGGEAECKCHIVARGGVHWLLILQGKVAFFGYNGSGRLTYMVFSLVFSLLHPCLSINI